MAAADPRQRPAGGLQFLMTSFPFMMGNLYL
jgi:hypothetical protein